MPDDSLLTIQVSIERVLAKLDERDALYTERHVGLSKTVDAQRTSVEKSFDEAFGRVRGVESRSDRFESAVDKLSAEMTEVKSELGAVRQALGDLKEAYARASARAAIFSSLGTAVLTAAVMEFLRR
jgi:chromosome segregation ATPase